MIKKLKKGFTIVELVIVIAVIAILTAVLVPTISSVVRKAQVSADTQLIRNLNTALKEDEAFNKGKRPDTMHEALEIVAADGYIVAKINNAKATENKILWDSVNNVFVYLDKESDKPKYTPDVLNKKSVEDYQYWTIASTPSTTYSTYLYNAVGGNLNVSTGLDIGNEKNVTSITYAHTGNVQKVVIRTNGAGTTLTVNAPNDTVHHYDYLDELTVTAVAPASYHEHGTVRGKATISQGHLVIENEATVPQVIVQNVPNEKTAKITANNSTVVSVDADSENKTTVVANAEAIYVSGEVEVRGSKSEDVVKSDLITTWAQLKALEEKPDAFAKLGTDITDAQNLVIASSHKFKLDLNGHTLQTIEKTTGRHYYLMDNYGECEIFDSKNGGQVKARGIENLGGKMTIQSGKFYNVDNNGGAAVWNDGDGINYMLKADVDAAKAKDQNYYDTDLGVSIANGYYTVVDSMDNTYVVGGYDYNGQTGDDLVKINYYKRKSGELIINGGEFIVEYVGSVNESYGPGVINSQAGTKLTINGGIFTSANMRCYAINSNGETVINDCTVNAAHGALAINSGNVVVNGGSYTCTQYYGCWITNDGSDTKVTINGGSFSGSYGVYSSVDDGNQDESNVAIVINGGNFVGQSGKAAIINDKHSQYRFALSIYGGTYNSDPADYLAQGHSARNNSNGTWTVSAD